MQSFPGVLNSKPFTPRYKQGAASVSRFYLSGIGKMRMSSYFYTLIDEHEFAKTERNTMNDYTKLNSLTRVLFGIYLIALFWILLFKLGVHFSYMENSRSINLIPFRAPVILNGKLDFGEMIMNVLIFVPLGIYAGILYKRWIIAKKLFLFFIISLIIESLQLIFGMGAFDITDIINNTLGGTIGLLTYIGIEKLFNNSVKAQKFINVIAAIGTVFVLLFLFLLRTNRLGIRYQ